jgi:hypothetical protein
VRFLYSILLTVPLSSSFKAVPPPSMTLVLRRSHVCASPSSGAPPEASTASFGATPHRIFEAHRRSANYPRRQVYFDL